jgi:hypothetical protein
MRTTLTVVIRVREPLSGRLAAAFDGLTPVRRDAAATELTGQVADQAQLFGLLAHVRDLGLTLASVDVIEVHHGPGSPPEASGSLSNGDGTPVGEGSRP